MQYMAVASSKPQDRCALKETSLNRYHRQPAYTVHSHSDYLTYSLAMECWYCWPTCRSWKSPFEAEFHFLYTFSPICCL